MLVTVITPTIKSRSARLVRCVASVEAQTYMPREHLVELDDPPANDWGVAARLRALQRASGERIAYLDDDDAYRPNHLRALVDALEASGADFAYSQIETHMAPGEADVVGSDPPQHSTIGTNAILHRRELLEKSTWQFSGEYAVDWGLVSRWLAAGARYVFVPEITVDWYRS